MANGALVGAAVKPLPTDFGDERDVGKSHLSNLFRFE